MFAVTKKDEPHLGNIISSFMRCLLQELQLTHFFGEGKKVGGDTGMLMGRRGGVKNFMFSHEQILNSQVMYSPSLPSPFLSSPFPSLSLSLSLSLYLSIFLSISSGRHGAK